MGETEARSREGNPNWKGGRVVDPRGYVLVRVGVDHHLSDVRGYAYEHRLVAERKIGRRLTSAEQVHHIDENRSNNHPSNLSVLSPAEHHFEHRTEASRVRLRAPGEANDLIFCACGCSRSFAKYDASGRPRRYISGHNNHPSPTTDRLIEIIGSGVSLSSEIVFKARAAGLGEQATKVALSKMKARGLVLNPTRGLWTLAAR